MERQNKRLQLLRTEEWVMEDKEGLEYWETQEWDARSTSWCSFTHYSFSHSLIDSLITSLSTPHLQRNRMTWEALVFTSLGAFLLCNHDSTRLTQGNGGCVTDGPAQFLNDNLWLNSQESAHTRTHIQYICRVAWQGAA